MSDILLANPKPALLTINGAPVSNSNPLPTSTVAGGGGAVTLTDGADVTQGALSDAAVTGDNSGSLSAKLRGINKILNDVWDSVNHRIKVDGSGVTQPVSAVSLPLPTGAATETTLAGIKTGTDKIPASPSTDRTTAAGPFAFRLTDGAAFYKATTPTDTQPVSAAALPLPAGASTEATLAGIKTGTDKIPASPSTDRTTAAGPFAFRLSDGAAFYKATTPTDTQPVSAVSLPLPTGAATETTLAGIKTGTDKIPASPSQEHTTAASPNASRLTDGSAFYDATKTGQLPSALVSGRLDVNVGNTPTVAGGKTNNNAAPGATNVGTLGAIANAADPSWTEGNQVGLSTNLLGHLRSCVNGFAAAGAAAVGNPVYNGGIDGGGLIRGMLMDTSGRQQIAGAAANGAAVAGNPVWVGMSDNGTIRSLRHFPGDGQGGVALLGVHNSLYNESLFDAARANTDQTVLTSALRTTTQTVTFTNYNSLFLRVVLDVTAVASSSLVLTIDVQDAISGKWINLLTGAAVTTVTTNVYVVGPGMPVTANLSANSFLGRNLRVVVTPGNANNTTYSVGRQLSGT